MAEPATAEMPGDRPKVPLTPIPTAEPPEPVRPSRLRRWARGMMRGILLVVVPLLVVLVGGYYWMTGGRYVKTDNAYVRADKVAVGPEVDGRVTDVLVSTNDTVLAGDILFRIDDESFGIALSEADAQLTMVRTEIAVLRANYQSLREQVTLAETDALFYEQEFRRQAELAERNVTSGIKVDQARHDMDMAIQEIAVREKALGEVLAKLGGDPNTPDEKFARFINARSRRDKAALDLRNTVVRAPADGIIGRVDLRPGSYVETGKPVISLVETGDLWFEANLKERDLTHVAIGQPATIRVDSYPDHEWNAKVVSFSPATGAEFSLLPPQNATGNWVKVVQRVPVRLRIDRRPDDPPLRIGMSATVSIDTSHERRLPGLLEPLFGWLRP